MPAAFGLCEEPAGFDCEPPAAFDCGAPALGLTMGRVLLLASVSSSELGSDSTVSIVGMSTGTLAFSEHALLAVVVAAAVTGVFFLPPLKKTFIVPASCLAVFTFAAFCFPPRCPSRDAFDEAAGRVEEWVAAAAAATGGLTVKSPMCVCTGGARWGASLPTPAACCCIAAITRFFVAIPMCIALKSGSVSSLTSEALRMPSFSNAAMCSCVQPIRGAVRIARSSWSMGPGESLISHTCLFCSPTCHVAQREGHVAEARAQVARHALLGHG